MSAFTTPLRVEPLGKRATDGRCEWKIIEYFEFRLGHKESNLYIPVYPGAVSDFASIPRLLWSVLPPFDPSYGKAAVIHDLLYTNCGYRDRAAEDATFHPVTKAEADLIFLTGLIVLGCPILRRNLMYLAVQIGGRGNFNQ